MSIGFLDLKEQNLLLKNDLLGEFAEFIDSGQYILHDRVKSFEQQFARYTQCKYCIGTANGLNSLEIILKSLGIGKGDEVLVPSNTYIATWLAITNVGAQPVPVEPSVETYNLDPNLIEAAITDRCKAIIMVHLYGLCCDIDKISDVANKHDLFIIEDAAQAHGARYKNRMAGSLGDAAAFSFYPSKNLGCLGDGGAITTNNLSIVEYSRLSRNYGSEKKYFNTIIGTNSRLDELQAAFLSIKLRHLSANNKHRSELALKYKQELGGLPIHLPDCPKDYEHAWHLFVIRLSDADIRANLVDFLSANGIETMFHYPLPPHKQKAYSDFSKISNLYLPISELLHSTVLSLPIGPTMSIELIRYVCSAIRRFFN